MLVRETSASLPKSRIRRIGLQRIKGSTPQRRAMSPSHLSIHPRFTLPLSYYASYYGFTGSIAVDPSNSSTVYVGQELGLFKTTTGGKKWDSISSSMRTIQAIAIDPSDSAVVYVGSLPASFFGILGGVS